MTTTMRSPQTAARTPFWQPVCSYEDLATERGSAALLGSTQIALFRTFDGSVFAISNQDPFTGAYVLSRGIVGTRGDVPTVASPLHKQVFDLRSGACLDDPTVSVATYEVRRQGSTLEVLAA